uniref:NADH-ubiquinone oxidoreductase chain 6 n=1 Tax=Schedorhinotermes breinli TaxID=1199066 RepID=I6T8S5_9NEOP|nr:NADH dehydrogenase subunit 6 [Schedorhinotermes breinli]AFM92471.1 NADH dehydrogenase subunit 6 [Schedorhinotermes breinli]QAX91100.1 NADH dehydrogenase subunit 6 [Schedorhinotermes breinli]
MNLLMTMSMATSMLFTQTKHPMAMGLILLTQTILMCLISGTMFKSFWFSYILFMIMIGGMLVLFMYMTSIASNEMFLSPNKMITIVTLTIPLIYTMMIDPTSNKEMSDYNTMTENEVTTATTPMYEQMTGTLTILLVMYMLLTLIVVVKMININWGPLRQTK